MSVTAKCASAVKRARSAPSRLLLVKSETQSFYEIAVSRAVERVSSHLDDAIDMGALARQAALSPFHFHRVFRGMIGETPLELHRRLRMERAAWRIVRGGDDITAIAFEAGYETHEAFTRAFRELYAVPPSSFRRDAATDATSDALPHSFELAARCGIHFRPSGSGRHDIYVTQGVNAMQVDIRTMPVIRLATIHHVGPYSRISEAFAKLDGLARIAKLFAHPEAALIAVYYDNPDATPASELRSDAGVAIPARLALPEGVAEVRLRAGRYACTMHEGSYQTLGDTWARLMGEWLPRSKERVGGGESFELYRNNPGNAKETDLKTELYVPLM